jgi:hypothetical protein
MSRMAGFFREKSGEATLLYYFRKMSDTAATLEERASYFAARCRCGGD